MSALDGWLVGERVLGGGSGFTVGDVVLAWSVGSCSGQSLRFSLGEGDKLDREVLLHKDCGREEVLELEVEHGSGDGVGRQARDESLGDGMDSTINGYWE